MIDGFEWVITESHLLDKHGCTICGGKTVERGINDTWTTNPDLAAMLVDNEVGYYYTQNSSHKTDWKCPDCGFVIKNKSFKDINQDGLRCPRCRDGFPFGEKFVVSLLDQLQVNFYHRYWFDWAGREYDIYIPDLKCIIEIHGRQHYETVHFNGKQSKSLEYVQQNDMYKYQVAINNGIEKYIVIDARNSNDVWIKRSILNSELSQLYDMSNINWQECKSYAVTSLVKEACRLWNDNLTYTTKDIREIMQKGDSTIRNWLKIGAQLGWCDYAPDKRRFFGNCSYCNQKNKIMNMSYIEKGKEYIKIDEYNIFVREARYCPYCKKDTLKH